MNPQQIINTALEFGYINCGIIGVDDVSDYADRLLQYSGKGGMEC
jgi:hypothetical protein